MAQKMEFLYEGKAKRVYRTERPDQYWIEFKDDATAFDGKKKGQIVDKGYYNAQISAVLLQYLEQQGIPTHFIQLVSDREMLVKSVEIIQVEVVPRNLVAGSLAKRLGLEEGTTLGRPVLEFYYKSDPLGDPMINEYHIAALNLATPEQMQAITDLAWRVNQLLAPYLREVGLELVDFKLEFGLHGDQVLLADEISPDTCRFWDVQTRERLDKDRFRRDLGGVEDAYREVWQRVQRRNSGVSG